jgi:hypothetical protein
MAVGVQRLGVELHLPRRDVVLSVLEEHRTVLPDAVVVLVRPRRVALVVVDVVHAESVGERLAVDVDPRGVREELPESLAIQGKGPWGSQSPARSRITSMGVGPQGCAAGAALRSQMGVAQRSCATTVGSRSIGLRR